MTANLIHSGQSFGKGNETGAVVGQASDDAGGVTAGQILSRMDANGDGKIDMDEAPEQLKAALIFRKRR